MGMPVLPPPHKDPVYVHDKSGYLNLGTHVRRSHKDYEDVIAAKINNGGGTLDSLVDKKAMQVYK